jgi:hypothetical protein
MTMRKAKADGAPGSAFSKSFFCRAPVAANHLPSETPPIRRKIRKHFRLCQAFLLTPATKSGAVTGAAFPRTETIPPANRIC